MVYRRAAVILLLCVTAVATGGCAAIAVGAGTIGVATYQHGDLNVEQDKDLDTVYVATLAAVKQLELGAPERTKDSMSAKIGAVDASGVRVTIRLTGTVEGTTKISIRVGFFGDERKSRLIYDKIRDNLGG